MVLVLAAVLLLALSGCTPAAKWGMRLNADGTVDFVQCGSRPSRPVVNYHLKNDPAGVVEWEAVADEQTDRSSVVRYGDDKYNSVVLLPPPDDWEYVTANSLWVERHELEVGHWVWSTADLPWVPGRPCDGLTDAELEE